jgi:uncharacterized membrane protein
MVDFFSPSEKVQIIDKIREAESRTSGEIRVHLASDFSGDILVAALKVFKRLGMDKTEGRNGVLFYIVPDRHRFAILGDKGIDEKVPDGFWKKARDLAESYFRRGEFCEGVCKVIEEIGNSMKVYFPHQGDADINELPDEISFD